jgi:hypothetical protein
MRLERALIGRRRLEGQGWGYAKIIHILQIYFYLTYLNYFNQLESIYWFLSTLCTLPACTALLSAKRARAGAPAMNHRSRAHSAVHTYKH